MLSIQEQIQATMQQKKQHLDELYFVDYCNNCRTGLASKYDVPCHHPWYCWHETGTGDLQAEIVKLQKQDKLTTSEYHLLNNLKMKRRRVIIEEMRKWRKTHS